MPALPDVPGVVKVQHRFNDGLDTAAICREYFRYTGGPPSAGDALTLATAINALFVTDLLGQLGSVNVHTATVVTDLSSDMGGAGEYLSSNTGTRSGSQFAGGTAVLENKVMLRRYRGGKPRVYWPFFTDTDFLTPQSWLTASLTGLHSALATYYAAVNGETAGTTVLGGLCNVSYYAGFASVQNPVTKRWRNISTPRATPIVDDIGSYSIHTSPASQRRRNKVA